MIKIGKRLSEILKGRILSVSMGRTLQSHSYNTVGVQIGVTFLKTHLAVRIKRMKILRVRWCFQSVLYNVTMQTEKGLLVIQMTSFCNRLPRKIFTGWFFFLIKKNWFWPCLVAGEASQADLWVKSSPAMPEIQKTRFRSLRDLSSLTRDWTCAHCGRHVET